MKEYTYFISKNKKYSVGDHVNGVQIIRLWKENKKRTRRWVLILCECGNTKKYLFQNIFREYFSKSCGCKKLDSVTKHAMTNTHFYKKWDGMKYRCNIPSSDCYEHYGGRGIKICERWLDFDNFYVDMYDSYKKHFQRFGAKNTTIDRIDVNGDYDPNNCRWATVKQQIRNTRVNRNITAFGVTKTQIEWSEITGLCRTVIARRIDKWNWEPEKALTEPLYTPRYK